MRVLPEERARLGPLAEQLKIERPIVDGVLRQVGGACVFLEPETALCRLHKHFGAAAKPHICGQYPWVAADLGTQIRVGVDPGCYTAFRTVETGELQPAAGDLAPTPSPLDPALVPLERMLLGLLELPGQTVGGVLCALSACGPGPDGLPVGWSERWWDRVESVDLGSLIAREDAGPSMRLALPAVVSAARVPWDPAPGFDAWAVECARRMVSLRLARQIPMPPAVVALTLGGALMASAAHTEANRAAWALAAWLRAIRAPVFWSRLLPTAAAFNELMRGKELR